VAIFLIGITRVESAATLQVPATGLPVALYEC
jgi:hypothetical protein